MAKTVEIRVDADRAALSVETGRLFVGTVARVRLDGWIPDDGFDPVLTMFPHDCAAPLAQSRTEDGVLVLDLTGAALRRAFCRCPARHQFALYLNQRDHDGRYRPDVDAVGTVYVDWSPEVFDVATGEVATLKGPPGNPGVDGMSAYELAVANGYRGTVLQWLEDLKGAEGPDGISAYEVAVRNGFAGTEAQWLESLRAGVSSIGGKSGDLSLEDIGAQPALPFDVQWQAYGITAARALCDEHGEQLAVTYAKKSEVAAFVNLLEVTPGVYELKHGLDTLTFPDLRYLYFSCKMVKLTYNGWGYDLTRCTTYDATFDLVSSFGSGVNDNQKPRISSVRMLAAGDVLQVFEAKELALKSDIPSAPSNSKVTIAQGGVEKGSFTLNQAEGASVNLPAPSNAKVTIVQGGVEKGSFTLNQAEGVSINLDAGGGGGGGGGGGSGHKVTVRSHNEYGSEPSGEVIVDGVHLVSDGGSLGVNMFDSWHSTYSTKHLNVDELVMDGAKLVCPHANDNSPYAVKVDGVPFTGNNGIVLSKDIAVDIYSYYCIAADTPITLADGTVKPLRDIGYDDDLMVWDFDSGTRSSAKPAWVQQVKTARFYWRSVFENGKVFRTVGPHGHRVYNLTKKDFLYIDECEGDEVLMQDLTASRLVRNERVDEPVLYSNIITKKHINFFAEGILATCVLNRIYPVDGMKFMKEARALRKFEDYGGRHLTREWFDDCRYSEQPGEVKYLNDYAVRTHESIAKSRI